MIDRVELETFLELVPRAFLRRVPGRETFVWPDAGSGAAQWVVKRTQGARPLAWLGRPSAAQREHASLVALRAAGIPVPRALGWCGRGALSVVVMEHVEHAETLRERLGRAGAPERAAWCAKLVQLVSALHAAGWYHRDLYLQHLVLGADGLVLLDVGRARRAEARGERWFVKDLAALLHSTPRAVGAREQLRFLARYLDARGLHGRRARRHFAARVLAKERRLAAHVPRAGEDRPWRDR